METVITLKGLTKRYKSHKRGSGFIEAVKAVFNRQYVIVDAVKGIDVEIKRGERVGFVGPNGAGKSTTIKMMVGILYPTEGEVSILGFTPWRHRTKYVRNIGVVFGQKSQLWFDLPPADAFQLSKEIYSIPEKEFRERLDMMVKMLSIAEVMKRPTRELSLGERMKCEFVMALLHNPPVLFLDEPTIGVDALAKQEIRDFLMFINRKYGTTFILTTHDMDDIEEVCERIIVIDEGKKIYDGGLDTLKRKYVKWKTVDVDYSEVNDGNALKRILSKAEILEDRSTFKSLKFDKREVNVPEMIKELMDAVEVVDLSIHEARLEHVIKEIYGDKKR